MVRLCLGVRTGQEDLLRCYQICEKLQVLRKKDDEFPSQFASLPYAFLRHRDPVPAASEMYRSGYSHGFGPYIFPSTPGS
jgi:hypothetical protein